MSNRKIYREIAKKYGVSVEEVKKDMQSAINHGYMNNTNPDISKNQSKISKKGEIPTIDEVLHYAKKKLK